MPVRHLHQRSALPTRSRLVGGKRAARRWGRQVHSRPTRLRHRYRKVLYHWESVFHDKLSSDSVDFWRLLAEDEDAVLARVSIYEDKESHHK